MAQYQQPFSQAPRPAQPRSFSGPLYAAGAYLVDQNKVPVARLFGSGLPASGSGFPVSGIGFPVSDLGRAIQEAKRNDALIYLVHKPSTITRSRMLDAVQEIPLPSAKRPDLTATYLYVIRPEPGFAEALKGLAFSPRDL